MAQPGFSKGGAYSSESRSKKRTLHKRAFSYSPELSKQHLIYFLIKQEEIGGKMFKRLFVVLLAMVLLCTAVFPVNAEAQKIPVSGTCEIIWIDEENSYYVHEGYPASIWHGSTVLSYCDLSDNRLDGYILVGNNWNANLNENGKFAVRTYGFVHSADAEGNPTDLWNGSTTSSYDKNWVFSMNLVLNGIGVYRGLHADLVMTGDYPAYDMQGELLVAGR